MTATLLDVAPEPTAFGVVLAVILFVSAVVILLAGGLCLFLWYRKRSLRHREMARPEDAPARSPVQASQPNQP